MKKILTILLLCLIWTGCASKEPYEEITFTTWQDMMDNKEDFILFIGSHNCNHCTEYKETLKEVVKKYKIDIKYIDVAALEDEEYKTFTKTLTFDGTPTTVFIKKGIDDSCNVFGCDKTKRIEGALSYDTVVEILKGNGYIKR